MQEITAEDLHGYRLELVAAGLSPATLSLYLRAVRLLFNFLEEAGQLFTNPASGLTSPRSRVRLLRVPSEAEVARLLAAPATDKPLGVRDRALMETAYSSALRREELAGLAVGDLDLAGGTVRLTGKGRKERVVPLGRQARYWLGRYLSHGRPELARQRKLSALWVNKFGRKLQGRYVGDIIRAHGARAGICTALSGHSLRRASATHMLQNGAHPVQIQHMLGHENLRCLSQYLKVTVTDIKEMHDRSKPGR